MKKIDALPLLELSIMMALGYSLDYPYHEWRSANVIEPPREETPSGGLILFNLQAVIFLLYCC